METKSQNQALLVMDMQTAILRMLPDVADLVQKTALAISSAREKKIPVLYVIVGFRTGAPELSTHNKALSASRERWINANMEEWMRIEPSLAPHSKEIVVIKRRVSAFTGSDLEVVLRALGIQHLVLTGVATSGVVLSTLREAADKDYQITVLSDACADADPEVHRVLTTKVFPRQADVITIHEWCNRS
jgi:nicotinamidase-related amidase